MMDNKISFDKIASVSLLYDFYGKMLPERQRQAVELYYEENLSLAEIAEEFGISRQGVHDALKNAEKALTEYETKMGLIKRFQETAESIRKIDSKLTDLIKKHQNDHTLQKQLSEIKAIVDEIE